MVKLDRETLIQALKEMVVQECDKDISPSEIGGDEVLIGGPLALDSLDALQICMAVKSQYGVRIEAGPHARASLQSVTTLADAILVNKSQ